MLYTVQYDFKCSSARHWAFWFVVEGGFEVPFSLVGELVIRSLLNLEISVFFFLWLVNNIYQFFADSCENFSLFMSLQFASSKFFPSQLDEVLCFLLREREREREREPPFVIHLPVCEKCFCIGYKFLWWRHYQNKGQRTRQYPCPVSHHWTLCISTNLGEVL